MTRNQFAKELAKTYPAIPPDDAIELLKAFKRTTASVDDLVWLYVLRHYTKFPKYFAELGDESKAARKARKEHDTVLALWRNEKPPA